jgi:hypothetical protein
MNPIHNPFSRDEHPDLTAAILGVVNESHTRAQLEKKSTTELRALRKTHASKGAKADSRSAETLAHIHGILRSRGVGAALDEDLQTPERAAEMGARKKKAARHSADAMKRNPEGAGTAAIVNSEINLHIKDKRERDSKKTYGKGGKVVREAVTAAQQKVFARERERMLTALNNPKQKLSPTEREAVLARGARNAAAETRKGAVSPTGEKSPIHSAAKAHHEYARRESKKLDAIAKRKVQEAAQNIHEVDAAIPNWLNSISLKEIDKELKRKADAAKRKADAAKHKPTTGKKPVKEDAELDERLVGGADFLQASKNLLTGKGFKTNREVSGARVNANMAAMQRRKARAAKKTK